MADNKYTISPTLPQEVGNVENYDSKDINLIESFELNSAFDSSKHVTELHVYTLGNTLLRSVSNYLNYRIELGSGGSNEGSSTISLDPQRDAQFYGYGNGGVKLLYIFYNNLFSDLKLGSKLYIKEISSDRTELKLSSTGITTEDLKRYALQVKEKLEETSFFSEFRLNFGNNELPIGINIDFLEDENVVTVKLYEPLPSIYTVKSTLDIIELVSESVGYEIEAEFTPDAPIEFRLREANFNIDIEENTATPSQFFNYDELFSFQINNSNYQILSLFNEKGAEISIDHSDYDNFIHFSSAEERLVNFKYKLDLIKNYEASLNSINSQLGSSGVTNNTTYYENLLKGIVDNFDHYERFLYFESGSYSWPKSNNTKPYENQASSTAEAITWFTSQRTEANNYDVSNFNTLTNTIPAFIREDDNNEQYVLFVQMLAQHFDNLYIYAKAVSDKYDADNRINVGVSRDLVEEAIKSLGIKLYNSSKSLEDLFKYFIDESAADETEVINNEVQAGILVSGGTTVEGPNQGFTLEYTNIYNFVNFPGLNSTVYAGAMIALSQTQAGYSPEYSYGFNDSYFSDNAGGDVYVTLTDSSNNNYGPFRYELVNNQNYFTIQPGKLSKSGTLIYIHPTDADGEDRSSVFSNLHFTFNAVDIKIEDVLITENPSVTNPIESVSQDIYQKSVYKRIYHNLPFLIKSKGTYRGLRALINCFGIPDTILDIKTYGGRNSSEGPFFGDSQNYTLPTQKVRTNNTGSVVEGDTLSRYASIVKNNDSYNQDLHNLEVGFSPSDNINDLIQSTLTAEFNIDDYIGDPRDLNSDSYNDLLAITKTALADITERYNVKDFVRLIKFFDNVVFKMVKDFVPARSTTDTGIIIKPHLLDKSKTKSVTPSATRPEYSGSIDTAFASGSHGGIFSNSTKEVSTNYVKTVQTPFGSRIRKWSPVPGYIGLNEVQYIRSHEESKFDGELANSRIRVSNGELNDENPFKEINYPKIQYNVYLYSQVPDDVCIYRNADGSIFQFSDKFIIQELGDVNLTAVFNSLVPGGTKFYKGFEIFGDSVGNLNNELDEDGDNVYNETNLTQYSTATILAYSELGSENVEGGDCFATRVIQLVRCTLQTNAIEGSVSNLRNDTFYNLFQDIGIAFDSTVNTTPNISFTKQVNGGAEINIDNPENHQFNHQPEDTVVVKMFDNNDPTGCKVTRNFIIGSCYIAARLTHINNGDDYSGAPDAGDFWKPLQHFLGGSDTTEYYIKIHTQFTGNNGPGVIDPDTGVVINLPSTSYLRPETTNSTYTVVQIDSVTNQGATIEEYAALLKPEDLQNGIENNEIAIFNKFKGTPNQAPPINGITHIEFIAKEPAVNGCVVSTGKMPLAEFIIVARYIRLNKNSNTNMLGQGQCLCLGEDWMQNDALYYYRTPATLDNPLGLEYDGIAELAANRIRIYKTEEAALNDLNNVNQRAPNGTYTEAVFGGTGTGDVNINDAGPVDDEVDNIAAYANYNHNGVDAQGNIDPWGAVHTINCDVQCDANSSFTDDDGTDGNFLDTTNKLRIP